MGHTLLVQPQFPFSSSMMYGGYFIWYCHVGFLHCHCFAIKGSGLSVKAEDVGLFYHKPTFIFCQEPLWILFFCVLSTQECSNSCSSFTRGSNKHSICFSVWLDMLGGDISTSNMSTQIFIPVDPFCICSFYTCAWFIVHTVVNHVSF